MLGAKRFRTEVAWRHQATVMSKNVRRVAGSASAVRVVPRLQTVRQSSLFPLGKSKKGCSAKIAGGAKPCFGQ